MKCIVVIVSMVQPREMYLLEHEGVFCGSFIEKDELKARLVDLLTKENFDYELFKSKHMVFNDEKGVYDCTDVLGFTEEGKERTLSDEEVGVMSVYIIMYQDDDVESDTGMVFVDVASTFEAVGERVKELVEGDDDLAEDRFMCMEYTFNPTTLKWQHVGDWDCGGLTEKKGDEESDQEMEKEEVATSEEEDEDDGEASE